MAPLAFAVLSLAVAHKIDDQNQRVAGREEIKQLRRQTERLRSDLERAKAELARVKDEAARLKEILNE